MSAESVRHATIRKLLEIRKNVTDTLQIYSEDLLNIKSTENVPSSWIIEFADYVSRGLSAPMKWTPGNPLVGGHPPAPQPEQMRIGMLGQLNEDNFQMQTQQQLPVEEMVFESGHEPSDESMEMPTNSEDMTQSDGTAVATVLVSEPTLTRDSSRQPNKKARIISISFDIDSESENEDHGNKNSDS